MLIDQEDRGARSMEEQSCCRDDFDFDTMAALARDYPLEFAKRRAQLIDLAIASCVNPEKGKTLQTRIDSYRADIPEGQDTYVAIMAKGLGSLVGQLSDYVATMRPER